MRLIRAFAHRGGRREITENSYESILHTQNLGYRYYETDLHISSDGVVYLQHDHSLYEPWGLDIAADSLDWEKIAAIRSPQGHRPVSLEEALTAFPQMFFNIEPKCDAAVEPAVKLVKKLGAEDRVLWSSFSVKRMAKIRRLGVKTTGFTPLEVAILVIGTALRLPKCFFWINKTAVAMQVPVKEHGFSIVNANTVAMAHKLGYRVDVWTINDEAEMRRLLDLNIDGIMTDYPGRLKRVITETGRELS